MLLNSVAMGGLWKRAFTAGTGKVLWDVASRSLSFLITVLLARSLGAEGYGSYAVYWYGAWMLSQITDLGLHLVSLRSLAREFSSRLLWSAALAKGALTAVALLACGVVLASLPASARLLAFLLLAQLIGSWVEFLGTALRSRSLIAREGLLLIVLRFGWLAAALAAVHAHASLGGLALALALSGLPALALGMLMISRVGGFALQRASASEAGSLLKDALPLAATSVITLLYLRADLLIVAALRDATEAGLFQGAFRIFEATFVLSGGLAAGTFPLLAARIGRDGFESLSQFVLRLLLMLGAPTGLFMALFSEPILGFLYGDAFRGASTALSFLGIGVVAVFVNALTTLLLVASGRSRRLVLVMALRLLVGVGLDLLLVPSMGAAGAALSVAVAEWSLVIASFASVADLLGLSSFVARTSPCA